MVKRILKILLGVALLPVCFGFSWQFGSTLLSITYKPELPYYFIAGCLVYLTVHILFRKPILTYVIGHELTHAFFAMLFGGSVKSFKASERGGQVTITKSNVIITLAPYFFPLYTFLTLLVYWVSIYFEVPGAAAWLIFLSGATVTFHVVLTLIFLRTDQNDIREHGIIFSYPLIYLFNVILGALLVYLLLADNMNYFGFLAGGILKSTESIVRLFKILYDFILRML